MHPLLNNSKWVKLITKLVQNHALIRECRVKLVGEEYTGNRKLIITEDTDYNFDYYATAMEAMISGKPSGWYSYAQIEWLDFPSQATQTKGASIPQDIAAIRQRIEEVGLFHLESSDENLRLYAYLPA